MPIISFLNPKGGSGKTTLCTNLARALHDRGERILLVDSDPQGSASDWHAAQDDNAIPLIAYGKPDNLKALPSVGAPYDYVFIDGAAKLESMIAAAVKVSDFVLIPVQPSPYDIWAASDLVDLIRTRQDVTAGAPRAAFIISRAVKRTRLGNEINSALAEYSLPVFASVAVQRQIYPRTAAEGRTIFDARAPDAAADINAIADELVTFTATQETADDTHDKTA